MNLEIGTKFVSGNSMYPKSGIVVRAGMALADLPEKEQKWYNSFHCNDRDRASEFLAIRYGKQIMYRARYVAEGTCYPDQAAMVEAYRR